MRTLTGNRTQYSPKDLIAFLEGDFAAWCERYDFERRAAGDGEASGIAIEPDPKDEGLELAKRKGDEHEKRYIAKLRVEVPGLVEIARGDSAPAATLAAMRAGAPVIYQGCLTEGDWQGYPDLLYRVPGASELGDWHYEPRDIKLALSAKPYFLVQLCAYAGMLEAMQGVRPEQVHFIFGNSVEESFTTNDYFYYCLQLKESFLEFQAKWDRDDRPDPGFERSFGRWKTYAGQLLEERDHLSRVANITRNQVKRLEEAGIKTLQELAESTIVGIPRIAPDVLTRLRRQAVLQRASLGLDAPKFELRAPNPEEPDRGLSQLPEPSPLDAFFDMEGFPFYPGGLEYLFGAVTEQNGASEFHDWWAHDPGQEKRAFEAFIDFAYARWQQDPGMHIYHYAAYEKTALRRLMGKYATRENEVDDLLRGEVLVDLYQLVRQSVIIGAPGYSLKDIERLYMAKRAEAVTSAGDSVIGYQAWIDSGESQQWSESPLLKEIREYNRVDCESTVRLRDWLLERKAEFLASYPPAPEAEPPGGEEPERAPREPDPAAAVAASLADLASGDDDAERGEVTQLIGWLVEYHRREEKPMWWKYFDRLGRSEEQLRDDFDCLTGLVRTGRTPRPVARSLAHEYRFDPDSDTKLHEGSKVIVTDLARTKCTIVSMDPDAGLLELKLAAARPLPDRLNLIPDDFVSAKPIKESILRFAERWTRNEARSRALDDLLYRRPPRIRGHAGGVLVTDGPNFLRDAIDIVTRLDNSTLCIQGPPGTGKTYTAAAMIVALLQQGKRVGIAANSHKVILNVMAAILENDPPPPANAALYKVGDDGDGLAALGDRVTQLDPDDAEALHAGAGAYVLGGTAWLFSRPALEGSLDYLFIDEAGQVPLANAVAMGQSAKNIVLIGDQMQLAQPLQGTQPGESGMSCLEYALNGHATIPPEFGIFLGVSYRLHPDVCRFISDAFYEGRLRSDARTEGNRVGTEHGVRWIPVEHEGNSQSSDDETDAITRLVGEILTRELEINNAPPRAATPNDVLLVAPFNMQVRNLRRRLDPALRVGSVDKFQGQEAAVVVVSMCSSSLEDCPRGAEFLLSPNRLNVAVSRAKAVAVVVGSPALMAGRCRTIYEMRMVNVLCRFRWVATTPS